MPWKILLNGEPGRTVEQFFYDVAWVKIQSTSSMTIELISAYLGRSLDEIELSIRLDLTVATYGGYLRYVISQPKRNEPKQAVNAFAMLMGSQRQLSNKDFLRNGQKQLLRSTLQCNTGFAVRKEMSFPSD